MDCGLPGQSKVVTFQLFGKGRGSSHGGRALVSCADRRCPVCSRSAQFEHTVVITSEGAQILTKLPHED